MNRGSEIAGGDDSKGGIPRDPSDEAMSTSGVLWLLLPALICLLLVGVLIYLS